MQHVKLGLFRCQKFEHLGARPLHHLGFAAFRQRQASEWLLGAGVQVACDQLNRLLGHASTAAQRGSAVSDVRPYFSHQLGSLSVGGKEEAEGTAQTDAAGATPLQTWIEQALADQWQQGLLEDGLQMGSAIQQLLTKGLAERRWVESEHSAGFKSGGVDLPRFS